MLANQNRFFVIRLFIVLGSRGFFKEVYLGETFLVRWGLETLSGRSARHTGARRAGVPNILGCVGQECPTYWGASGRSAQHTGARRAGVPNILGRVGQECPTYWGASGRSARHTVVRRAGVPNILGRRLEQNGGGLYASLSQLFTQSIKSLSLPRFLRLKCMTKRGKFASSGSLASSGKAFC